MAKLIPLSGADYSLFTDVEQKANRPGRVRQKRAPRCRGRDYGIRCNGDVPPPFGLRRSFFVILRQELLDRGLHEKPKSASSRAGRLVTDLLLHTGELR